MKIKIVRIAKNLPLPKYKTKGAVAFDIYSRISMVIKPQTPTFIPSNLIIEIPQGYALLVFARSGTHKKGLWLTNGVGIIDQDYHGPDDEIKITVYNFTAKPVYIEQGERIAQGIIVPVEHAEWQEVKNIKSNSRGGFGTTGK